MLTAIHRILERKLSIGTLIEAAFWLAIPYVLIGVVLTFTQPGNVRQVEHQMEARIAQTGGFDTVAFGLATVFWPALLATPPGCRDEG